MKKIVIRFNAPVILTFALLSLLALGVKNIYLGPTLPAFLSEPVVKMLVDAFGLQPTTHPQQDLDAILQRG